MVIRVVIDLLLHDVLETKLYVLHDYKDTVLFDVWLIENDEVS
jgi:hypothetical protein